MPGKGIAPGIRTYAHQATHGNVLYCHLEAASVIVSSSNLASSKLPQVGTVELQCHTVVRLGEDGDFVTLAAESHNIQHNAAIGVL